MHLQKNQWLNYRLFQIVFIKFTLYTVRNKERNCIDIWKGAEKARRLCKKRFKWIRFFLESLSLLKNVYNLILTKCTNMKFIETWPSSNYQKAPSLLMLESLLKGIIFYKDHKNSFLICIAEVEQRCTVATQSIVLTDLSRDGRVK